MMDGSNGSADATRSLHELFFRLWRFGSNALVGWTATPVGIEILTIPKIRLFAAQQPHRRVFSGDRLMGAQTFCDVAESLGLQPIELRLDYRIGEGAGEIPPASVERVFSSFAITRTESRALFLLDIVGFSKFKPEEQASQLATMEFALNIAAETARGHGVPIDMARSTTGDGYYVWNKHKGSDADVHLGVGLVLYLAFSAALARVVQMQSAIPTIRACLGVGSHYSYHHPEPGGPTGVEYIVGDVTISAARLIGGARPGQILIGDFHRIKDDSDRQIDVPAFLNEVGERLARIGNVAVFGSRLARFSLYPTGPRQTDGGYRAQRLRLVDKHGFEHFFFNAKVNVFPETGEPYYCGLRHEDLLTAIDK